MNKVYRFWMILLGIAGGLSLLYFGVLVIATGLHNSFYLFWLAVAIVCACLILLLLFFAKQQRRPPRWVTIPVEAIVGVWFLIFILLEACIIHAGRTMPQKDADYMIILGAKVNGTRPTLILQYRIEAAVEYLRENPGTMVIASGGKGSDEEISEAQCIAQELIDSGIAADRILLEERSVSTRENLLYSAELLDPAQDSVVITTTDFHLFRALRLAGKCGYTQVTGKAARSVWWLIPTNYTREFFAVMKELFCGNL